MAGHDFFFALEFSSQGAPAALLENLSEHVFKHVGCPMHHLEGLSAALEKAAVPAGAVGDRRCDVQFRARNNELEVLVSSNGGRVWQTSIILP
jgi:hypothetical protein